LEVGGVTRLHVFHPSDDPSKREIGIRPKMYEKSPADPRVLVGRLCHLSTPKREHSAEYAASAGDA
jgi:hypothetical protein